MIAMTAITTSSSMSVKASFRLRPMVALLPGACRSAGPFSAGRSLSCPGRHDAVPCRSTGSRKRHVRLLDPDGDGCHELEGLSVFPDPVSADSFPHVRNHVGSHR